MSTVPQLVFNRGDENKGPYWASNHIRTLEGKVERLESLIGQTAPVSFELTDVREQLRREYAAKVEVQRIASEVMRERDDYRTTLSNIANAVTEAQRVRVNTHTMDTIGMIASEVLLRFS